MDLPNAIPKDERALLTGTPIGLGAWVQVVDLLIRSKAGMSSEQSADWRVELMATIVPPTPEEAAEIERAQASFPGVCLYAIQVCSYYARGEHKETKPLCRQFVAESSCFWDHGEGELEEDLAANMERWGDRAPEIYFGSSARDMAVTIKAETGEVKETQRPKISADMKKCATPVTNLNQFNFSLPADALKPSSATASNLIDFIDADAFFEDSHLFGPSTVDNSKWPPDLDEVEGRHLRLVRFGLQTRRSQGSSGPRCRRI